MPNKEETACTPLPVRADGFNDKAVIPYGLKPDHIKKAMDDFIDFLGFINVQLRTKRIQRLESFLMPANFSSMDRRVYGRCNTEVLQDGHQEPLPQWTS